MKKIQFLIFTSFLCFSCVTNQANKPNTKKTDKGYSKVESDKITISNPDQKFEVIIIDIGFDTWLLSKGKQRGFYDQTFLETKNRIWVNEWNSRSRAGYYGYDYTIDYNANTNYGYEVNYMLYNYLLYWQESNNVKLN